MKKLKCIAANFSGRIRFAGEVSIEDLRLLYRESDIFSLTPIITKKSVEGFGFVYLEASYFGLPIIATRVGGVEDAVLDRKTGLLSDPDHQEELKSNLTKLVENRSLREELGANGINWAKKHKWENVAKELYFAS
jgi:phosphatidylinositol alpha-1,6-mannosyltransferase